MAKRLKAGTRTPKREGKSQREHEAPASLAAERLQVAEKVLQFGTWDWDLFTGQLTWSPELEAIYGLERGAFGRAYTDFACRVHPQDLRYVERTRDEAMAAGRSFDVEFRIIRPDGEMRWVRSKGDTVRDAAGRAQRVVGINIDITEQKRVQHALSTNEARLGTALKLSELLIFHQDRQLRYTWIANPTLGLTAQGLIGRCDEDVLGKDEARPLTTLKRRVLRTGYGERQEVWVARNGQSGCFDLIVEPDRGTDGKISGVICAATDITQRKRAEEELQAAYQSIGHLVDRLQDEMEGQRRELAREVHDQVGATLTGIRMHLEGLLDVPRRDELLRIRSQIDQALASTRTLCTRLRPPMLDDLGLAETLRWYVRDWARHSGVGARTRISAVAEPADPLRIDVFRMLQELLTNVARHSGAQHVSVTLSQGRGKLRLRVSDDGHGFPAGQSIGLGLLGIRERLRRHGGQLLIDPGSDGTTVTLSIPCAT